MQSWWAKSAPATRATRQDAPEPYLWSRLQSAGVFSRNRPRHVTLHSPFDSFWPHSKREHLLNSVNLRDASCV